MVGLVAPLERKNGWSLAERAGEAHPIEMQRGGGPDGVPGGAGHRLRPDASASRRGRGTGPTPQRLRLRWADPRRLRLSGAPSPGPVAVPAGPAALPLDLLESGLHARRHAAVLRLVVAPLAYGCHHHLMGGVGVRASVRIEPGGGLG
ncbi:hypothetical protein CG747_42875 [Streptomyces sp. CB02959]|nr:hypothetical protein CG747_42875 [Streptomyces sp. CB02959]